MNGVLALADAAGWEFTRAALGAIADSQDTEEGVRAFLEKRVPVWTGR
jgi:crotonobetainyl-CoA hydratase